MNIKKNIILLISFMILIIFLLPLVIMIYTSFIPQGNMTNIVKEFYLNDFEARYMSVLKRTISPLGSTNYSLVKESPETSQSLLIESKSEKNPGIKMIGSTRDLRKMDNFNFWLKLDTSEINNGFVIFEDINGNSQRIPFLYNNQGQWAQIVISKKDLNKEQINLKYITGISIILNNEKGILDFDFLIDDIQIQNLYPTLLNYIIVWNEEMFGKYMLNSFIVSGTILFSNLLFSSMVAYAFARRDFKGKNVLFAIVLITMMIPFQVTTIPIFILMKNLNLLDTYFALILPQLVTPFGIFILKQYIEQLPIEIEQAAVVDGAGPFTVFFKIILPLSTPALAVMGINTFITTWNDLFMPLILTSSREMRTAQVGLALYQQLTQLQWPYLMSATTIVGLPIMIAFLIFQKQIISGITAGSVKG